MHFLLKWEHYAEVYLRAESSLCRIQGCVLMDLCNVSTECTEPWFLLKVFKPSMEYIQKNSVSTFMKALFAFD